LPFRPVPPDWAVFFCFMANKRCPGRTKLLTGR
jgi:hypothetical protein